MNTYDKFGMAHDFEPTMWLNVLLGERRRGYRVLTLYFTGK